VRTTTRFSKHLHLVPLELHRTIESHPLLGQRSCMSISTRLLRVGSVYAGLMALALTGCVSNPSKNVHTYRSESVILIGDQPASLAHSPIAKGPVVVQSTYLTLSNTVVYAEGKDYVLDRTKGLIQRTEGSRLPDFRKNVLYGQEDFDHSKFPGFGNNGFFTYVTYTWVGQETWPVQSTQATLLPKSAAKLRAGGSFKVVAYGDSITAGGDATSPDLIFWKRWSDSLAAKYPQAKVTAVNGATGGDSTVQGLARLQEKVLTQSPDLVLIGFGMNDHNKGGVPIPQFEANLKEMIRRIRETTGAEVVLFSAFPPNPKWKYGSHRMEEYSAATQRVATSVNCAFADVYTNWQSIAARKKYEDLLGNNINHPNDYGHGIYFEVLKAMGL
jgi:lysophospholipase L1-like esterase